MPIGDDDLYRIWIEEIARLREGRRSETHFFVSVNLAAFGALGFLLSPSNSMPGYLVVAVIIAMILVNVSWKATDLWYARITARKFRFIHDLEQGMARRPITDEHDTFKWRGLAWLLGVEKFLPYLALIGFAVVGLVHAGFFRIAFGI